MSVTPIVDHAAQAQVRLTSAYAQASRVKALLGALCGAVQDIEDAIQAVAQGQLAKGGTLQGAALDVLGRLVGIERQGIDDVTFTALIYGQIGENTSDATTAAVIGVAAQIFQSTAIFLADPNAPVHNRTLAPATVQMAIGSPKTDASLFPLLTGILRKTLGAGISLSHVCVFDMAGAFAFAGPQPWPQGFCALDGTGGGPLATLIYSDPAETP